MPSDLLDTDQASGKANLWDFANHFRKWENGKVLLGTAWCRSSLGLLLVCLVFADSSSDSMVCRGYCLLWAGPEFLFALTSSLLSSYTEHLCFSIIAIILGAIGFGSPSVGTPSMKRYIALKNISVGNIVLSLAGTLPGYYATFFLVDKWGRKQIGRAHV